MSTPYTDDHYVDLSVMQIEYTMEYSGRSKRPVIHIFGRTEDWELKHVKVYEFKPYFYAASHEVDSDISDTADNVIRSESGYSSLRGNPLTKIVTEKPKDVRGIRTWFESDGGNKKNHYEADIQFTNRFMLDNDISSGVRVEVAPNKQHNDVYEVSDKKISPVDMIEIPKVMNVDIEVEDRYGFPEDGEEPIISITAHDVETDEYIIFMWKHGREECIQTMDELFEEYDDNGNSFVYYGDVHSDHGLEYDSIGDDEIDFSVANFTNEEDMLLSFIEYVENVDPDCITGWNFTDFDMPYILDRYERTNNTHSEYNIPPERFSRIGEISNGGWKGPDVKGRIIFDLLEGYKKTKFSEMDSYRLDAIGEVELGVGKEHHSGKVADLWIDDPKRLIEYNLRDVEICVELDRKQEVIAFWNELRTFVGCKLEESTTPGDAVDMYILHKTTGDIDEKPRFILPSKGDAGSEDYEGGSVFDAISGVVKNVTVLDLKSLYPMCMITINASPETKVDPDTFDGDTYRSPNDIHFRQDEDGIIREMVTELLTEREKKKELRNQYSPKDDEYKKYDRQQGSVKVVMNSLYGVLGWEKFRLYDKEMGAAVTATGRGVIEYTEQTTQEMGYNVTYGDTDSVLIGLGDDISPSDCEYDTEITDEMLEVHGDKSQEELEMLSACMAKSKELEDAYNESYQEYAEDVLNTEEHHFKIEYEKLYRRFFQAGKKKRYAGNIYWKEGNYMDDIDITGFEYERSDIAVITKETQYEVINKIVRGKGNEEIKEYVSDVISKFNNKDLDLETIGMPGGIGKGLDEYDTETAQVRGAKYANLFFDANLGSGDKPKRVYIKDVDPSFYDRVVIKLDEQETTGYGYDAFNTSQNGGGNNDIEITTADDNEIYKNFRDDINDKKTNGVICFQYSEDVPDEFNVDWDTMLEKIIEKPIRRVVEAIDIDWGDVENGTEQAGLENFF